MRRWAKHVAHIEELEMHAEFSLENLKSIDHSENLGVDRKIILEWTDGNRVGNCELDSYSSGYGPVASSCEHRNEPSGALKCW